MSRKKEIRPAEYPKLEDYTPTQFMLPTSHYDEAKGDRAVAFFEELKHTKAEWKGDPFWLLGWQERIVRDVLAVVDEDGNRQFQTVYIEIPKKQGKQLALDTPIPTPDGFTTMGEICVGDELFDENGSVCHVVAKSQVDYDEQAYRITFKDGTVIEAGARHQWAGEYTHGKPRACTMTTEELSRLPKDGNSLRFRIPVAGCAEYQDADLPVEPYLMGYWLGNGSANKHVITVQTCDVPGVLAQILPYHHSPVAWDNTGDSINISVPDLNKVLVKSFHDKVIPDEYLCSSKEQRFRLLQGLMDSDGCINDRRGQGIYSTTEKAFAESVSTLLWSLGIKNAITSAPSTQRADWSKPSRECGRVETGATLYTVKFTCFDDLPVASLERKLQNRIPRNPRTRSHYRYIDRIEKIENRGMQCIQVDSHSHQYLAGKSYLPTHNSELAAGFALYLLYADDEPSAEVFSAAADRQQAGIVFEVARSMVEMAPALLKRSKIVDSQKRIVNYENGGYYRVVSADINNKDGYSISGLIFDELHSQPSRDLWDLLTKGSGDARRQALHVAITTAGTDRNSICYELHQKARDMLEGKRYDPTFYPVIYGLEDGEDWQDEKNWLRANPSIGYTVPMKKLREAYQQALENPAEENLFKRLRLNVWTGSEVAWIPDHVYDKGNQHIDLDALKGRDCYAGLDLSSTSDITAFVMVFPPRTDAENYIVVPHFWLPSETIDLRERRDHVPYRSWMQQGLFDVTEGNVVDYNFIRKTINELGTQFHICEIGVDRWNATQLITDLTGDGFTMVPIGMSFRDMSPGMKELYKLFLEGRITHGGDPVLKWMAGNVVAEIDAAENIKPSKKKSTEKIDGIVALIMGLDRAIRHEQQGSVYDERGLLTF